MSFETYQELEQTENELIQTLKQVVQEPFDVTSSLAKTAFQLHKNGCSLQRHFILPIIIAV